MKHNGIIQRVIEAVGLYYGMPKGKFTPSEANSLVKAENDRPVSKVFSYSSVLGMLPYISGNTHPDVALYVSCCYRYMFSPTRYHKLASKILERYLKQTKDQDLVLDPNSDVCKVKKNLDAKFSGMYGHEKLTDPACVKSRTKVIISFADFPVCWVSKLRTDFSLYCGGINNSNGSLLQITIYHIQHCNFIL